MNIGSYAISTLLTSLPYGKETKFVEGMIEGYKTFQKERGYDKAEHDSGPRPYFLFGTYDIAFLYFGNDLELSNKVLPGFFEKVEEKDNPFYYDYNISTGISIGNNDEALLDFWNSTQDKHNWPFIGITKLKINTLALIGNGQYLLEEIKEKIESIIDEYGKKKLDKKIKGVVLGNFGFSEMTLIILSDSMKLMSQVVEELRHLSSSGLGSSIYENSLLKGAKDVLAKDNSDSTSQTNDKDNITNHVFLKTVTVFGFNFEFFKNEVENDYLKRETPLFTIFFQIKPGHIANVVDENTHSNIIFVEDFQNSFSIGKDDILVRKKMPVNQYIKNIYLLTQKSSSHIVGISTSLDFQDNEFQKIRKSPFDINNHFSTNEILDKFSIKDIEIILQKLSALGVSRIVIQQLKNVFSLYLRSIGDYLFFSLFIELDGFINSIVDTVDFYYSIKMENVQIDVAFIEDLFKRYIELFEMAFRNRYFQSLPTMELSDNNLFYNGGVQQILSAYDSIYKALFLIYTNPKKRHYKEIAVIGGANDTHSFEKALKINFNHLLQPSSLICIIGHEVGQWFLNRLFEDAIIKVKNDSASEWIANYNTDKLFTYYYRIKKEFRTGSELRFLAKYKKDGEIRSEINSNFKKGGSEGKKSFTIEEMKIVDNINIGVLLELLIVDRFSLRYSYFNNFDLFSFWHWIFFIQQPGIFKTNTKIKAGDYFSQYLRHKILSLFILGEQNGDEEKIQHSIVDAAFKVEQLFIEYKEENLLLDSIAEKLLNIEKFKEVLSFFYSIIDSLKRLPSDEEIKSNEIVDALVKGEGVYIEGDDKDYFEYVCKINYSFLNYFYRSISAEIRKDKEDGSKKKNEIRKVIVNRNIIGEINTLLNYTSYSVDPRGGWRVGKEKKKEYFRIRMTLLNSFWDLSQKMKKEYILDKIKER